MKLLSYHFILTLATLSFVAEGQSTYIIDVEQSKVWVEGTSTLRNWSAHVAKFEGKFILGEDGNLSDINLTFDVKSMDGGRGPDMNAKIYKALKSEEYPVITFSGKGQGSSVAVGRLSMAGKSMDIEVAGSGSVSSGSIMGEQALKLSDFEIEPPSAMFGQIVCHDDLILKYELTLKKSN